MDCKLLFALISCILAVAQARPAAVAPSSTSSCSLSCSGRKFWTGYAAGKTYQYSFQQKVELKSSLSQEKSVLMQVSGKANFEVHSDCEMVLTVDIQETKSSKSPSEAANLEAKSLPKALVDSLKAPLRFSFEDGRVGDICPGSEETRASLNFKRGLLSQLHLSIDQPDQETTVRENDVLGNCWTVYKQTGANKVEKTKDLSSCTNNFEVFPRQGVKYEAPRNSGSWPTVVEGSLKCTIELDGQSMVIKENLCEENRALDNSIGESGKGENVKVETSLRFERKLDSLASTLFDISDRSDMKHQHKTGDSCHDSKAWFEEDIFHTGNECLEKKLPSSGVASTDFKTLAQQTLEQLCEETRANEMLNTTAAKFADAIKYMRGITSQSDFDALFDWGKTACTDNNMFKIVLYSALPTVGTRYSVKVMLNQLKEMDSMNPDAATSNWLVNGIAMMPHPTPEIVSDVLNYTKKVQEESMMPTKDAPLALAAVTGRYCTLNSDCENNREVDRVLTYFSDALGPNCSKLAGSDDPTVVESAFTALLSIGNIGRAKGGAAFLVSCAENSDISVVFRTFVLRSLRRFPSLSGSELMRLGSIIGTKELDSELRIAAYQAMVRYTTTSFWSDERALKKLSKLMQDEREDVHVQRYIHSHLSKWLKKQSRLTDSFTASAILREYERRVIRNSKLGGLQVSGYWLNQFKNPSMKSKLEVESNVIYSRSSAVPRFVSFNFTTESPLSAESVNMFEFGVRMEGMEGTLEQVFNAIQGDRGPMRRKRRQASEPVLTDEQKQYQIGSIKQRLDVFTRQNGMELKHINFDEAILGAVPAIMKTVDLQNLQGLAWEKLSDLNFDYSAQAAGTQMETTISIPTISGFPILMKKEMHYLLNLAVKNQLRMSSMVEMSMGFELQPSASVYMARTVTVDSGFERAGLTSRTSGVTSLGAKMSVEADFTDLDNILFSYKLKPLKKRQKVLELKTDIQFIQHSGPKNIVESPVLSELTPVTQKCFTEATTKLLGRKLCLETNFEQTYNPLSFVRQNPGSFRLYIDKDDSLGGYEATLSLKIDDGKGNFTAVLGDPTSSDRHAKFQFVLERSTGLRKITLELANPVLPIKWESESKTNGANDDINVGLKFGSTNYVFRGTRSKDGDGSTKLEGDFYRQDRERQKLGIITKFQSFGFLPLFQFDFSVTTPESDKLSIKHLSKYEPGNFELSFLATHEKANSVLTSIKSRLVCTRASGDRETKTLIYNTEVTNKNGKNFIHTFTARVDRTPKSTPNTFQSTVSIIHKFNFGVTKQRSALDVEINLNLEETIRPMQLYKAIGTGSVQYGAKTDRKTASLTKFRFVLGEDDVVDGHFNTKTFLLEYAADVDGSQSEALVALQVLPLDSWRLDNQCVFLNLKATKTTGAESKKHALELRHTSGYDSISSSMNFMQVAKMVYSDRVLLDLEHRFYSIPTSVRGNTVLGHHLNVTAFDDRSFLLKNQYSFEYQESILFRVATVVAVNQATVLQVNQSLSMITANRRVQYQLDYDRRGSRGTVAMYAQDYSLESRSRTATEITSYLLKARREGFKLKRFFGLVKNFIYQIKLENGFQMDTSSMTIQMTNYIDMTVTHGVMFNITRLIRSDGVSFIQEFRLAKQVDPSTEIYRRVYKVYLKDNDWEKLFTSEVIFKKSPNPQLSIALSKESLTGSKSGDYNFTSIGRFIPQVSREGQIAVQLNITNQYKDVSPCKINLNIVVDTKPSSVSNPALNVSLGLTSSVGDFKASYNLGLQKSEVGRRLGILRNIRSIESLTSELNLTNTIDVIPFRSYYGINTFSSSSEQPFNIVVKKALDGGDLINIQATLNSKMLYIGVKSDSLPVREVSYTAEYNVESDGFLSYVSQVRFRVPRMDLTVKDNGRFKASGRNGKSLFSIVYSGNMEFTGLDQVIGTTFPMDRLDYNGNLDAKTTGEFDTKMEMTKVQGTTSESLGLVSVKLNYWPFEISSQMKTPLWDVGHYGFNISAGPKAPGNGFRFKAWLASPAKQSALKYWHTSTQGETFDVNSETELKSDHLMPGSDPIKSTLKITGRSMYDFEYSMNVTTPFPTVQRMQIDITENNQRQSFEFTLDKKNQRIKVLDYKRTVQVIADSTRLVNVTLTINSFAPEITGLQSVAFIGDSVIGSDYFVGMEFRSNNVKVASIDFVYVTPGNTYPQLSRLSVPGAYFGFDLKGNSPNMQIYLLRSGDSTNGQWKFKYASESLVEATITIANGRVTAGSGEVLGQSVTFTSPSEGSIQVTAGSADGSNTITWTSSKEGNVFRSLEIRFSISGQASCVSYSRQGQQMDVRYGSCETPNTLKVTYQISNFWELSRAKVRITVEHNTVPEANRVFYLLPQFSIPITVATPFNALFDIDNEERKGTMSFTRGSDFEFSEVYDLGNFPNAMQLRTVMRLGSDLKQSTTINYDITARTVDIRLEMKNALKFVASTTELSLEVNGMFIAGVAYTTDETIGKKMIEFKGEWKPATGSVPCFLRIWKQSIENGAKYGLQFQEHSGKDISIVSDVTNYKFTATEFTMDVTTALSSTLIESLRSSNSVMKISYLKDATNNNYTITYKESLTAGGVSYYELESMFRGQNKRFPSTFKVACVRGYIEADFSYNFNKEYNAESYLRWSMEKFGDNRNSYLAEYRSKDVSAHVGNYWRDFSFEISTPRRQMYLSESCKLLANGTVQTEIQAYLNKRNLEGFSAIINKDFTVPNVFRRSLQLTLPTRKVGYERVMRKEGKQLGYNLTIFWDMHSDLEKKIDIQFNCEKGRKDDGYYYYHKLEIAAPFLKNKVTKELRFKRTSNRFDLSMTHGQESNDQVTMAVSCNRYWDNVQSAMQMKVNISFAQQKNDLKANARITISSKRVFDAETLRRTKYETEVNIFAIVPSLSIDSHLRIRSVPFEELTIACNHGATFSYRYIKGFKQSRVTLFVSDSNKNAGQLTLTCDRVKSVWKATLDTGKGFMNPKSALSFPIYKPTKVMVKVSAGLSSDRRIHFGIINGEMQTDSSMKLWKPETVPADLDFFFVGLQLKEDNTLTYASHWRIRRQTKKSPFTVAKEVLIDPWAKAGNLPISIGTINSLLRPMKQSHAENIDTDVVLDMLTSISSNDIDSLKRWASRARDNNEFMSNTIGKAISSAFYIFKGGVEASVSVIRNSQYGDALPSIDTGIRNLIGGLFDSAAAALNSIPVDRLWSAALATAKYVSDQIGTYFSAYAQTLDSRIRDRLSTLTGGAGSSALSIVYNAIASVYPLGRAYEKFSLVSEKYTACIQAAAAELLSQLGKVVQPILVNTLGELPKVYDFFENFSFEISQWRGYFNDLSDETLFNSVRNMENNIVGKSAFGENLVASLAFFLEGYYSRAMKKFFNTDANVVRVWRLDCDQACSDSGSFAAVNGTFYIPLPVFLFVQSAKRPDELQTYPWMSWSQKIMYRINYKIDGAIIKYADDKSIGGIVKELLIPSHRKAAVSLDYIQTFGGKQLRNLSPCRYLLAHDFLNGDFSIYQTYTWDGVSRSLGDLLIRFGGRNVVITNQNIVKLSGEEVSLPLNRDFENPKLNVRANGYSRSPGEGYVEVNFSTELLNVLRVKCKKNGQNVEVCRIGVHPLYHGRLNGAFGNNDGNPSNDLHGGTASEHMRLWTADRCIMASPSK